MDRRSRRPAPPRRAILVGVEASTLAEGPVAETQHARRDRALFWVAVTLALISAAYSAKQMPSDVRSYRGWINAGWPSWTTPGPYPVLVDAVWWPLRFVHAANVNPTWVLLWTAPATVIACLILWRAASRPYLAAAAWLFAAALLERSYWLRLEPVSAAIAVAGVAAARRNRPGCRPAPSPSARWSRSGRRSWRRWHC